MDAAHRIIKLAGFLVVITLLMAAPGWAQPVLTVPTTVSLAGTGGQDVPVTSSDPTTQITFTIGPIDYSLDSATNGAWLSVSGGGATPTQLSFNLANVSGLPAGTHTAKVTLNPSAPAGVAAVTITVSFSSGNPGGGGSGTLLASPNPVNVSASSGSSVQSSVTITTSSTAAVSLSVAFTTQSGGSWLTAGLNGSSVVANGAPTSILITANAFNLANGLYTGTVTITPSTGTALNLPVNFTVGGTSGGNGSWTVNPNSIPFSFNTNSGIFPSSQLIVTTSSGNTSYTASATSSNGWLLFNNSTQSGGLVGQAYSVSVGGAANTLTTGSYQGTITITDPNGLAQATVSVTLNVNGGNSNGLTINPNPLTVNSVLNGPQQNPTVSVTSTTGGVLTIQASLQSWCSFQYTGNTNINPGGSAAFIVNVNPLNLPAGTYSQTLNITVGPQVGTLTVNLVVGGGSGGGTGTTAVAPTSLSFAYQQGSNPSASAHQNIVITGPAGAWSSSITTSDGGSWLQLSTPSGSSLPDPSNSPYAYIVPTGLAVGGYSGNIAITTPGGTQNVTISLTVTTSTVLVPTPGSLVFVATNGQAPQGQSAFFTGSDNSVGTLAIQATTATPWITVSATNCGNCISVTVNPTGYASGVYSGAITVNQNNVANSPYTYPVVMVVNGGGTGGGGSLTFVPNSLSFSSVNGSAPGAQNLAVGSTVSSNFTYSTSYQSGSGWLSVSGNTNVTPANLTVSVFPSGLAQGTYNATISFNSNGFNQNVPVTLTVTNSGTGGNVTVSPTTLSFSGQVGAGNPAAQSISVSSASGAAAVTFSVTASTSSGGNWLTTNANSSNQTPATISVSASSSGLFAGTYNGTLAIQPVGGTTVNVPVTLTVTAPPVVSASPTSLSFTYRSGDANPPAQIVNVAGSGLGYTATASSTGNWLSVAPSTGTAPATLNVTVSPSGLSASTNPYTGTITVAGSNGATGTTTITVSLTVTAPLPTITKVTNAASYAQGTISPGEIITLFAGDPTHPIGPSTPAGLAIDPSTGKVATTIGGVQVSINGILAPMVFASATQVSCVVPYELALSTGSTATVFVKFLGQSSNGVSVTVAATAPGLFTLNSSGTGPGAILNSNNSVNGPGNGATSPATRGDTVVVYLTGEGQTSPPGVTGKVTTVSSTPPLTPGPLLQVSVTINGQPATFSFAGEAPGFVSGVMQLNVQIPTNVGTGDLPIVVNIGGNPSQAGVTVSVR